MNKMVLVLILLSAAACDDDKPRRSPDTGTSVTEGLNFRSTTGKGVTEEPDNTFAIPACGDSRKLGYITTRWRTPLPAGATFTVAFNVWLSDGASVVGFEDYVAPGRAALYFQRDSHKNSDPYALDIKFYNKGYRQWSHAREMLTAGDHTFSTALVKANFTGGGSQSETRFAEALADPANVGITLSGAQSAGHGVCMAAGSGYVTIYSLTVN